MIVAIVDKPETERGMTLPCPLCGERDAAILLNLADVSECRCSECEEVFDISHIREIIDRWSRVIGWLDTFPK